jgi:outer membrane protein TolC
VLYHFEDSGRKVSLYADVLVPKAKELLSVSETAYKAGTVDFLSLIDAQRMLLGYQLNYKRAVTDNLLRLAELEMLAGAELSPAVGGTATD